MERVKQKLLIQLAAIAFIILLLGIFLICTIFYLN